MFSQVSVHGGGGVCLWSGGMWQTTPLPGDTTPGDTPPWLDTPGQTPPGQAPPVAESPWADTLLVRHPPGCAFDASHAPFAGILTARKRSLQRLCFHRCLSVHGGGCLPLVWGNVADTPPSPGTHPPWLDTPGETPSRSGSPRGRQPLGRYPPGQTPPWSQTPPGCRHPQAYTPQSDTPLGTDTPPPAQCMLGYGQQAGRTHATGMHSCSNICFKHHHDIISSMYIFNPSWPYSGVILVKPMTVLSSSLVKLCHGSGGSRISPRWGRQHHKGGCEKLLFGNFFSKNCMKFKQFGPRGGARPWRPSYIRQFTVLFTSSEI